MRTTDIGEFISIQDRPAPQSSGRVQFPGISIPMQNSRLTTQLLNVIDCGAIIVSREGELVHSNNQARNCFDQLLHIGDSGETVTPIEPGRMQSWTTALTSASLGSAQYLSLDNQMPPRPVSLQAIDIGLPLGAGHAVLICGARAECANDSALAAYAQAANLTRTETETLRLIVQGNSPVEVAQIRGVSEYTVRAQIKNIYRRTETRSQRGLLISVGKLSPAQQTR